MGETFLSLLVLITYDTYRFQSGFALNDKNVRTCAFTWILQNRTRLKYNRSLQYVIKCYFYYSVSHNLEASCWEQMMECCNGRGRFLLEAVLWWLFISLPINFVSILFAVQAPTYVHSDEDTYHYGYGYNSIYEANISQGN